MSVNLNIKSETIIKNFNQFNGKNLESLDIFYDKNVVFQDPVKKIEGLDQLKKYYSHVYSSVKAINFDFKNFIEIENNVSAEWTMNLTVSILGKNVSYNVKGCSFFQFNSENLVIYHRDYLDLGEMVYEQVPILKSIIKMIKKRI